MADVAPPSGSARPSWLTVLPDAAERGWVTVLSRSRAGFDAHEIALARAMIRLVLDGEGTHFARVAPRGHRAPAA